MSQTVHLRPACTYATAWLVVGLVALFSEFSDGWRAGAAESGPSKDWWSLKPLVQPQLPPPVAGSNAERSGNPIDAFVHAKLAEKGLAPAPRADRRTLLRRVYFDLLGLPPRPEEMKAFLADPDPRAFERTVDRLLESPQYGERWARHWLDVVHYGETHGYDKDQPRPNAWPYRDYVIRSFNQDKPYGRFVAEQVAGDVLYAGTQDGFEALGFVAAGPWDLIGHAEVPETKADGKVARHLDRDDMVGNTIQTFNSLTVQCAQCHNHKFDPITQEDYYSLQAVFAAVDRADKPYDLDPAVAEHRHRLVEEQATLQKRKKDLDALLATRAGAALVDLDKHVSTLEKGGGKGDAYGYHSSLEKKQDSTKWVQVDLGRSVPLGSVVLHPCKDDFNGIGEGFGFPVRFKVELAADAECTQGLTVVGDFSQEDYSNPRLKAVSLDAGGKAGRYLRVTALRLASRQDDYNFALAEVAALTSEGRNVALGAPVSSLDSVEAPMRWQRSNLTDGWYPGVSATENGQLTKLREERAALLHQTATEDERMQRVAWEQSLSRVKAELGQLPPPHTAYVAAVHTGSGTFIGTGGKGGKPRPIAILNRGNILKPGQEVGPGSLSCVAGLRSRFELPPEHREGERRAALAQWLIDTHNPLTWRSIVNRVWQYHFGRGLVETPNDFGHMGGLPSHPELLDWLAVRFRDRGQSLKQLHRLILTSATWCQSSGENEAASKMDSDNRYLWRQNRRKLDAEAVRDSVLFVSGMLDLKMGGPSFKDFVVDKPEHSPHYEYQLHDPEDPQCHRRSIYRFIVRSQQQPFMTTLDCADPSMQVGRRNESVSPLQALTLLNNPFMVAMSKHFAGRLEQRAGNLEARVTDAYELALGHAPVPSDRPGLTQYAQEFGLANYCRLLFNLNEFTFVD